MQSNVSTQFFLANGSYAYAYRYFSVLVFAVVA